MGIEGGNEIISNKPLKITGCVTPTTFTHLKITVILNIPHIYSSTFNGIYNAD
jgi:hypothetical protein